MATHTRCRSTYSYCPADAMSDIPKLDRDEDVSDAEPMNKVIIKSICDVVGKEDGNIRRPLRVVIIGKSGAGKSSFINSIATAFSGTWHEYSSSGSSDETYTYTVHALRYPKCCLENDSHYSDILLPTLIDVPGLSEYADEHVEELLRLLLYGHIKEDNAVLAVYEDIKKMDIKEVRGKYSHVYNDMKVDRVVFMASANSIPEKLARCVFRVARPPYHRDSIRTVPIFGVLTKADKVDTTTKSFEDKQKEFMKLLGLNATRFLLCKNYCDDTDKHQEVFRRGGNDEIDLPILQFIERLCDPALKVIREDELLPGTKPTSSTSESPTTSQIGLPLIVWLRKWKQALYAFYETMKVPLPHGLIIPLITFIATYLLIKDTWVVPLVIAFLVYVCCEAL